MHLECDTCHSDFWMKSYDMDSAIANIGFLCCPFCLSNLIYSVEENV